MHKKESKAIKVVSKDEQPFKKPILLLQGDELVLIDQQKKEKEKKEKMSVKQPKILQSIVK